jgi:hypothetical protein
MNSISSFKNSALGKIPLQGTEQLSSLISSSATNAISGVTGSLSSITGGLTGGLGGITSSLTGGLTGSLSSLTSSLPLGSVIGITSAISSIKSLFGGKGGVRAVSTAVNTVNRVPIDQKVERLLGDASTQTGGSGTATSNSNNSQSFADLDNRVQELNIQILRLKQTDGAQILQEEQSVPAGDLGVQKRKSEILARLNRLIDERNELERRRDALRT